MINILFGGNSKVFDGILLCVLSMIKHCKDPLNIYVLTADVTELNEAYTPITENQTNLIKNLLKQTNPQSEITLIKLNGEFNNWILNSSNRLNTYTPFAFLRLFADKIENLPNKIIYLDTDIMVNGNIKTLFDLNVDDLEVAVVKDRYGKIFIKPNYFNSGMLLMNMSKIKNTQLLDKVRNYCSLKRLGFPDQTALNKFCKHKVYLPRKFNEQGKLKNDTIVHHFSKRIKLFPYFKTINIKPWQIEDVKNIYKCHAYDDIFDEYLKIKNNLGANFETKH